MKISILTLLCVPLLAFGQSVELPVSVQTEPGVFCVVQAKTDCAALRWVVLDPGLSIIPPELLKDSKAAVVMSGKAGAYRLLAYGAKADVATPPAICSVVVGTPTPPIPPDPIPPNPPTPAKELRVLIVYETADLGKYPKSQVAILRNAEVRKYLDQKCVMGPDKKTREWRIWDQNVNTDAETQPWKDALSRKRDKLPWIVVLDGTRLVSESPLPVTVADTLTLLKKFGG